MALALYVVHAFTDRRHAGNPAAVCLDEAFPSDEAMRRIAAENRLSETAFAVPHLDDDDWDLRWFTPEVEVELCGHATLATAFVLFQEVETETDRIRFHTRKAGVLTVTWLEDRARMDFPSQPPTPRDLPAGIEAALGLATVVSSHVHQDRWLVRVPDEAAVRAAAPDFAALRAVPNHGVIVTAPGAADDVDFVSRFFAPTVGVDEDPVTGSAHCILTPYWAAELGATRLAARQVSDRGGALACELVGDRVALVGQAVLYARGEIVDP